ncbi:uncharacterized protein METZ01_LOCUS420253, partial [marine metagenome]
FDELSAILCTLFFPIKKYLLTEDK